MEFDCVFDIDLFYLEEVPVTFKLVVRPLQVPFVKRVNDSPPYKHWGLVVQFPRKLGSPSLDCSNCCKDKTKECEEPTLVYKNIVCDLDVEKKLGNIIKPRAWSFRSEDWDHNVWDLGEKKLVPNELGNFILHNHPLKWAQYNVVEHNCHRFVKAILDKFAPEFNSKLPKEFSETKLGDLVHDMQYVANIAIKRK